MQAASAFATLAAANSKSKEVVARAGGVPALVSLLRDDDPRVRELGANALAHLAAGSPRNQETIAQEGATSLLVQLLRGSSWPPQLHACRALAALAHGNARIAAEIELSGAVGPLMALLQGSTPHVQAAASSALENLAEIGFNSNDMIHHLVRSLQQGVPTNARGAGFPPHHGGRALQGSSLIDTASVEDTRQRSLDGTSRAAKLLKTVALRGKQNQDAMVQAGVLEPLVAMLKCESPDCSEARTRASEALTMLAEGNIANQILISRSGAIAPLVRLLDSGSLDEQSSAAGALEQLIEHSGDNRHLITQAAAKIDWMMS